MKQFSRILAAVDFSTPARGAFDHALALSQQHGAELVVLHAVPADEPFSWQAADRLAFTTSLRQRAEAAGVRFKGRVQQGDPADIILLHARTLRPDVIVIGTHQRSGIDRRRVGSVAERVGAKAGVPVLVVPGHAQARVDRTFRRIAVAVDFSPASDRAIEQALALAGDGDRVTLLHVVPGFTTGVPPHLYRYGVTQYQDHLVRDARRRLALAVPVARHTTAAIHTRVLIGDTTTEISRAVESLEADLLVVGVAARGALSRALFGSTGTRLLKVSSVPMLAVPQAAPAGTAREHASLALAA